MRRTGIEVIGDAPWGTHFCQFYATKDDLDVLVPYFKAGLEGDEFCMWVTSPPLGVGEAWEALAKAMPEVESYRRRGRIEIIPHTDWYLLGGSFDQDRVLEGWVTKLEDALARGCAGLRLGRRSGSRSRTGGASRTTKPPSTECSASTGCSLSARIRWIAAGRRKWPT
jgi:hypothetical protein